MIVCVCHRVNDKTIERCARQGVDFDDLQLELGVATQCGQCEGAARELWSTFRFAPRIAHLHKELAHATTTPQYGCTTAAPQT